MIIATLSREGENQGAILFVLEPGNLEKLKRGEPLVKSLRSVNPEFFLGSELIITFTPDIEWVQQQMAARGMQELAHILEESLGRAPIDRGAEASEQIEEEWLTDNGERTQ